MPEPVSPADTIRRDDAQAGAEWLRKLAESQSLSERAEKFERMADAIAALLAVGERDRRQIARLTEALEQIATATDVVVPVGGFLRELSYYSANGSPFPHEIARAVLADEEDARP